MGRPVLLVAAMAAVAALGSSAGAQQQQQQQPVSALKGHNSNAPVDVSSDRIEVQDRTDRAVFSGNVVAKQEDLTLATERLTVAYSSSGGIQIDRLDAAGGVLVRSPSETARGDFGVYDLNRKLITLIGNVQLQRQGNEVRGNRLTLDLNTGRAVIDGGPPGVGQNGGRVTGHFTVPQRQNRS
jgi:lipopolysaccharide export system protein LptA